MILINANVKSDSKDLTALELAMMKWLNYTNRKQGLQCFLKKYIYTLNTYSLKYALQLWTKFISFFREKCLLSS